MAMKLPDCWGCGAVMEAGFAAPAIATTEPTGMIGAVPTEATDAMGAVPPQDMMETGAGAPTDGMAACGIDTTEGIGAAATEPIDVTGACAPWMEEITVGAVIGCAGIEVTATGVGAAATAAWLNSSFVTTPSLLVSNWLKRSPDAAGAVA